MLGSLKALALALATAACGWAVAPARPGTLNYLEGRTALDGRGITTSDGSVAVNSGQVLSTGAGRAEMLLTPGVYLRLDQNSALRLISSGLTDTRVELLQGRAMIEATDVHNENHIRIFADRASVDVLKNGLYRIDSGRDAVSVMDGKALVSEGDQQVEVKGGREVNLNAPLKAEKFDKDRVKDTDPLYRWSKLRSDYLAEANASLASRYVVNGPGWYGSGWYWDPGWRTWGFMPGSGFLYSPFGRGFYSPWGYGWGPAYYYPRTRVIVPGRIFVRPGINPGVVGRSWPRHR